jgi:hypothetical protein
MSRQVENFSFDQNDFFPNRNCSNCKYFTFEIEK